MSKRSDQELIEDIIECGHDYFGVNIDVVWNIAKEDLSIFIEQLKKISQE